MTDLTTQPRRIRVGTIVWGALVAAVATFAILILVFGPLGPVAVLWTVIGFGSILVLGAIAAAIVRAARHGRVDVATEPLAEPAAITLETTTLEEHPPIG